MDLGILALTFWSVVHKLVMVIDIGVAAWSEIKPFEPDPVKTGVGMDFKSPLQVEGGVFVF